MTQLLLSEGSRAPLLPLPPPAHAKPPFPFREKPFLSIPYQPGFKSPTLNLPDNFLPPPAKFIITLKIPPTSQLLRTFDMAQLFLYINSHVL